MLFPAGRSFADLREETEGIYVIQESFDVGSSSGTVWKVLTDYDGMTRFISSISSGRVKSRVPLVVEQETSGGFLFLKRRVRVELLVREEPFRALYFEDVSGGDFLVYRGSWQIKAAGQGLRVTYQLTSRPNFSIPGWMARWVFSDLAADLMEDVRKEIVLRGRHEPAD